jgi:hypothetical protein
MNKNLPFMKTSLKDILGGLPLVPEVYWYLRQPGKPITAKFTLDRLEAALPGWVLASRPAMQSTPTGKRVVIFGTLRYWVEQVTASALALAGQGHQITLAFLPYAVWQTKMNMFDLRRQNAYTLNVLNQLKPWVKVVSFLPATPQAARLPDELDVLIEEVALKDTQYTLQMEQVNLTSELYQLRLERNRQAAVAALKHFRETRPEVVVIPNGTILEFGVVYQVARWLNIPVVTYEFGEQRERVWIAQNSEVMRQDTSEMWKTRQRLPLNPAQLTQVRELFASRQRASLWENFARKWQGVPSEGGERVREALQLDHRPVVLLATNVIGDSLTLGRQVFSDSMTEWLQRTVEFFVRRPEVQFVVRIHPGELITKGPSVADVVNEVLKSVTDKANPADHIHLVPADAKVNTYDLVDIADVGLVYTTTVGMEMAMSGVPVFAVGNTHYRGRGFTLDPDSWENYYELLGKVLSQPMQYRLSQAQVDLAWNYAYRFFFDYPHPFPWHLVHFWEDMDEWPLQRVLGEEGQAKFGRTWEYLTGESITWD